MNGMDVEILFTDLTMCEADGEYSEVERLMKEDTVYSPDWCVRSTVSISSQFGTSQLDATFHANREFFITDYSPAVSDVFYNPDLQILSVWASEAGWRRPEPIQSVIEDGIEFWKHFWEVHLVDSRYLDTLFGKRETVYDQDEDRDEED